MAKKNNEQVKSKPGLKDDALDALLTEDMPDDDIRRVIKKLSMVASIENLHEFCKSVDYENVQPSALGIVECNRIINEYVKQKKHLIHPAYVIDNLTIEGDVVFTPEQISGVVKKEGQLQNVVLQNKMGFFCDDDDDREKGAASSLLAMTTSRQDKGVVDVYKDLRVVDFFLLEPVRLKAFRNLFDEDTRSAIIAREFIYKSMKEDDDKAQIVIDQIYNAISYGEISEPARAYTQLLIDKRNRVAKRKGNKITTYKATGKRPASYKEVPNIGDVSFDYVNTSSNLLASLAGANEKKKGGISSTHYYGEITAAWHKVIARAQEIMSILKQYKMNAVRLPNSKTYGSNLHKVLIFNGISVVTENGEGVYDAKEGKTGHYRYALGDYLDVVQNPFSLPQFRKEGIRYPKDEVFAKELETFLYGMSFPRVTFTRLSPHLINEINESRLGMFPSVAGSGCKIWILAKFSQAKDPRADVKHQINRMMRMIIARAKFVFNRRPFFFDDEYANLFCAKINLPHVEKKEIKEMRVKAMKFIINKREVKDVISNEVYGKKKQKQFTVSDPDMIAHLKLDALVLCKTDSEKLEYFSELVKSMPDDVIKLMEEDDEYKRISAIYYLKEKKVSKEKDKKESESSDSSDDDDDSLEAERQAFHERMKSERDKIQKGSVIKSGADVKDDDDDDDPG